MINLKKNVLPVIKRERFTREEVKKLNDQHVWKEYVLNATYWDSERDVRKVALSNITDKAFVQENVSINSS